MKIKINKIKILAKLLFFMTLVIYVVLLMLGLLIAAFNYLVT